MDELTVKLQGENAMPSLPPVRWNKAEVEDRLEELVGCYRGRAYAPEDIAFAKKDRAEVNKIEKELAAAQKRVVAMYRQPVAEFEAEMKRLRGICTGISADIDRHVKEVEEAARQERRARLEAVYRENAGAEITELVPFDRLLESGWLNKSTTESTARKELMVRIETVRAEMETLRRTCGEDFQAVQRVYLASLSINAALGEYSRIQAMREAQARAEAAREAERKAQAAAPVVAPPSAEQRQARQEAQEAAQLHECITADGALDFGRMREQAGIDPDGETTYTRTLTITYTPAQGRALIDFLRRSGIAYELT